MEAKREKLTFEPDREYLHRQLVKLGDMMGDGLRHEPDGKWIAKEYKKIAKALGYLTDNKSKANNSEKINERMNERVKEVSCQKCNGQLTQTRSGSTKAKCAACGSVFKLLVVKKVRK